MRRGVPALSFAVRGAPPLRSVLVSTLLRSVANQLGKIAGQLARAALLLSSEQSPTTTPDPIPGTGSYRQGSAGLRPNGTRRDSTMTRRAYRAPFRPVIELLEEPTKL